MNKFILISFMGIGLGACGELRQKDVRAFIEGSYVRDFATEFAVGVDSVVLQPQGGQQYLITKYSRFARIKNGKAGREEVRQEQMTGQYDADQQVIHEWKKGRVISFDPEQQVMLIGASAYRKVK